ncbi:MAG: inositol monophosphatase family protein [Phycisphaerales bacterium]
MNPDLQSRLDFAVHAAQASATLTLDFFGTENLDRSTKHDGTPVTIADRTCERDLRERIAQQYPDDAILGEEYEPISGTTGYQWVIDPIDGTISFVHGVPLFGTMLACLKNGEPILGVIAMPALDETVYAATGLGCWHTQHGSRPTRTQVSNTATLDKALINTTSMSYFDSPQLRTLYSQLDTQAKHTRGWSDCYGWVLLATGRVDAVVEPVLSLWDFAAAIPIVREAGGQCSDFSGNQTVETSELIASNARLHDQLLSLMAPILQNPTSQSNR